MTIEKDIGEVIREDPISLIPGSATYRYIKADKSDESFGMNILGYVVSPLRDIGLAAFYGGVGYGLVSAVSDFFQ